MPERIEEEVAQHSLNLYIERYFLINQLKALNANSLAGIRDPAYLSKMKTLLRRLKQNQIFYDKFFQIYFSIWKRKNPIIDTQTLNADEEREGRGLNACKT